MTVTPKITLPSIIQVGGIHWKFMCTMSKTPDNFLPHNTDVWEHTKYFIIREAVAYIIQEVIGFNKNHCQFADLAEALNNIAGLSNCSHVVLFDKSCIKCAFKNGELTEYGVDCRRDNLTDFSGVLHVRIGHQVGSYRRGTCPYQ